MQYLIFPGPAGAALDRVVSRAASDRRFRSALLTSPADTLLAHGIRVPETIQLRPVEAIDDRSYIVLPPPPRDGEVSDEDLAIASGGSIGVTLITIVGVTAATGYFYEKAFEPSAE